MSFSACQDPGFLLPPSLPAQHSSPHSKLRPDKNFLPFLWTPFDRLLLEASPGQSISFWPDSSLFRHWFCCHILSEAFPGHPNWLWPALPLHTSNALYLLHPSPLTLYYGVLPVSSGGLTGPCGAVVKSMDAGTRV